MDQELQALNTRNKMAEWAERIAECRNSGQSVRSWCLQNGVSEPTYYKWQKKLYEMAKTQQESRLPLKNPANKRKRTFCRDGKSTNKRGLSIKGEFCRFCTEWTHIEYMGEVWSFFKERTPARG